VDPKSPKKASKNCFEFSFRLEWCCFSLLSPKVFGGDGKTEGRVNLPIENEKGLEPEFLWVLPANLLNPLEVSFGLEWCCFSLLSLNPKIFGRDGMTGGRVYLPIENETGLEPEFLWLLPANLLNPLGFFLVSNTTAAVAKHPAAAPRERIWVGDRFSNFLSIKFLCGGTNFGMKSFGFAILFTITSNLLFGTKTFGKDGFS